MADAQYSLAEVAKITGKSEKTISRWIKSGKLPAIRHGTGYLIDEADIPLRLDPSLDRHAFIQQKLLEPDHVADMPVSTHSGRVDIHNLLDVASLFSNGQVERKSSIDNISQMLQKHHSDVEKIIREQNELAEKYARATYKIGQLEERNRLLEENNLKLEQKMSLLPPPEQWQDTRQELLQLKDHLKQTEAEHQQKQMQTQQTHQEQLRVLQEQLAQMTQAKQTLEQETERLQKEQQDLSQALETEKKKGFWQRMFGG
ncbi:MAG: helix-turn-helix domain-containing protein [Candidatus Sericytochromatia bacterium]|nr:helix-turn-helix domain-containing protein [Candidatus Sericytochromatia bacterium]